MSFLKTRPMDNRSLARPVLATILIFVLAQPVWAATHTVRPELPNPGSAEMSKEQQQELGVKVAAEVYKQMPVLPDSDPVAQYVKQLGRRLEAVIPQAYSWPYDFHVIEQKEINAFALPGGPIFINIGTINAADNEAELAGVLAHEMSHIYMQHSAKQLHKQEFANLIGALGGLLGGAVGGITRFGAGTLLMHYSRKDEAQADAVGAIIMYRADYAPKAMAEFFQKLEKEGGSSGPQFLSDHPNPGNRVEAVEKEIRNWPPEKYLANSQDFFRAKQLASGIKAYTAKEIEDGTKQNIWERQNIQSGAIPPNIRATSSQGTLTSASFQQVKPSDNFATLEQGAFSIAYPANWKVSTLQNTTTIAPAAGVTDNAFAYGVVIGSTRDSSAGSLDQASQDLVQKLEQNNPGLRISGNIEQIRVAGVGGQSVNLAGNSPLQQNGQAQPERDWLVTLQGQDGSLLYLVFIAPESDFAQLKPAYQRMLDSLRTR